MIKILLDTDASIKLTKISIIESVASGFEVILTSEVYREQVSAGLERNMPVAGIILMCVISGLISKEKGFKYLELLRPMIKEEHIDRISILKQLLCEGTESYLVNQYSIGRISKGKLAELLDLDIYGVNELLEKYHVKSSITYERFTRGIEIAEKAMNIK
jgi:predicted HTH domain antitoxin